jgi:phosphoribosylformylglycinamidine synthase subunit PurQ / glutaminase
MKAGIVVFPGSNCDSDAMHVCKEVMGFETDYIWHADTEFSKQYDLIVIPGGFSYGDYLRSGAIARFANIMKEVADHAARGGYVLGICNGFQILTEANLLPGALLRNNHLQFRCEHVWLKVENTNSPFTCAAEEGQLINVPIAHMDGNYYADDETLKELQENGQIILRYVNKTGEATTEANPNGALHNIAGICNKAGNVCGMMPHPERAAEDILKSADGKVIFDSILKHWGER